MNITCDRHQQPTPRLLCDECEYEAQQQARDKHREDDYLMRLRDRMALTFATTIMHIDSDSTQPDEIAMRAYSFADSMLAARANEEEPK